MTVQIDDIVRINAIVSFQAQEYENVHHFKCKANATPTDTAFMAALQSILAVPYAFVQNHQSDLLTYERIEGQNITQDILLPTTNWVGNPSGDSIFSALPPQVCANVYWPTLRPRTRCTTYLPGIAEDANTAGGVWDTPTKADLALFGAGLIGDLVFGGITIEKGAYNLLLDRFTALVNAVVPTDSRTQRRRRLGVGI